MSELSGPLTRAAWAEMAGPAWRNVTYADLSEAAPDTVMAAAKDRVDRTVAAVLETLADQCPSPNGWWLTKEDLRQVAAEVKEDTA